MYLSSLIHLYLLIYRVIEKDELSFVRPLRNLVHILNHSVYNSFKNLPKAMKVDFIHFEEFIKCKRSKPQQK
jgi:hypothetical protein